MTTNNKRNVKFLNYIKRIRQCTSLPMALRYEATKRLIEMKRNDTAGDYDYINDICFILEPDEEPRLYEMFDWSKTVEGYDYWKRIADEGF